VIRLVGLASTLVLVGCIGSNPEWNRPDGGVVTEADDGGVATRAGEASTQTSNDDPPDEDTSGDEEEGSSSTETGEEPVSTTEPSEEDGGEATDEGPPTCPDAWQICAGVCVEIEIDKHACGEDCIDCTELYGDNAQCDEGECEPHDDGGGHDDD
jgi:hypothetical protein